MRWRPTDDRGRRVRLYSSPVTLFRVADSTLSPDVRARIARHIGHHRGTLLVVFGGLAANVLLFVGFMSAVGRATEYPPAQMRLHLALVCGAFTIASVVLLRTQWVVLRHVRTPMFIRAFLAERRCPGCAYDLTGAEPADDDFTICSECGAAWQMPRYEAGAQPTGHADRR